MSIDLLFTSRKNYGTSHRTAKRTIRMVGRIYQVESTFSLHSPNDARDEFEISRTGAKSFGTFTQ
jgi:hypothetical protein